jgi:type I restriction enzyme S subunit
MIVQTAHERLSESGARHARIAPPNSLLVTCIAGTIGSIGNVALTDRYVAFNQQINAFTPTGLDPLFAYMQLRLGQALIQGASTGGMKGLVNKVRFAAIELMVPPPTLQSAFSSKICRIADLTSNARKQAIFLQGLFTSLQQRAFHNEL